MAREMTWEGVDGVSSGLVKAGGELARDVARSPQGDSGEESSGRRCKFGEEIEMRSEKLYAGELNL